MNFSVEETPDSNVYIPMPVAGTFETCRRTRSMSVFIGGHRKSSAHAQNDAIEPLAEVSRQRALPRGDAEVAFQRKNLNQGLFFRSLDI
jgi:hypothetical protein